MQLIRKHLFLDLEETVITPVIEGWHCVEFMNLEKVRDFIERFNPDQVHLFSFALHDVKDLSGFDQFVRPTLQNSLGRQIERALLMSTDILPACCRVQKLHPDRVDLMDLLSFWGKQEAFRLFINDQFQDASPQNPVEVVLLDDVVLNETFQWPDRGITGRIINIDSF